MVLPTLFVGVQAIRTNALERGTLETLGQRLARSRTYADVDDAMVDQTQVVWRCLGGDGAGEQEPRDLSPGPRAQRAGCRGPDAEHRGGEAPRPLGHRVRRARGGPARVLAHLARPRAPAHRAAPRDGRRGRGGPRPRYRAPVLGRGR